METHRAGHESESYRAAESFSEADVDAAAALNAVRLTQSALADRAVTPWWYHPTLGVLVGSMIATLAADSPILQILSVLIALGGMAVLMRVYRMKTGLWIDGFSAGRAAMRWTIAMTVGLMVLFTVALVLRDVVAWWPGPIVCGALAVPLVIVVGIGFDNAYRATLRGAQ